MTRVILILSLLLALPSCELFVDGIFDAVEYEMEQARAERRERETESAMRDAWYETIQDWHQQENPAYVAEIIRNAENGDKSAQKALANMYRTGIFGVPRDIAEAEKWERLVNSED